MPTDQEKKEERKSNKAKTLHLKIQADEETGNLIMAVVVKSPVGSKVLVSHEVVGKYVIDDLRKKSNPQTTTE